MATFQREAPGVRESEPHILSWRTAVFDLACIDRSTGCVQEPVPDGFSQQRFVEGADIRLDVDWHGRFTSPATFERSHVNGVVAEAAPAKLLEDASQIDPRPRITAVATVRFIDRKDPTELLQAVPIQNGGDGPSWPKTARRKARD